MRTSGLSLLIVFLLSGGVLAQQPPTPTAGFSSPPGDLKVLGAADSAEKLALTVVLRDRNYEEFQKQIQQGKQPSEEEMQKRYMPEPTQRAQVVRWLESYGIRLVPSPRGTIQMLPAEGTVAQWSFALQTNFVRVQNNDQTYVAALTPPHLPQEIDARVALILGWQLYRTKAIAVPAFTRSGNESAVQGTARRAPTTQLAAAPKMRAVAERVWDLVRTQHLDYENVEGGWSRVAEQLRLQNFQDQQAVASFLNTALNEVLQEARDKPRTLYWTPEQAQFLNQSSRPMYVGIGVRLAPAAEGGSVIEDVFNDSPAQRAGLRPGDRILTIGGQSAVSLKPDQVRERIQGPRESTIALTVRRGATTLAVSAVRTQLPQLSVFDSVRTVEGRTLGYLWVDLRDEQVLPQVRAALQRFEQRKVHGILLDLRTGGERSDPTLGAEMARLWLDSGPIATVVSRTGQKLEKAGGQALTRLPTVVLVSEATMGSSEVLAAALQYNRRAVLVGRETAGYNSIRSRIPVPEGGMLEVTTGRWFTPTGADLREGGIQPDYFIELPAGQPLPVSGSDNDIQYNKAVEILLKR